MGAMKENQLRAGIWLVVTAMISGCASSGVQNGAAERPESSPPELWSHHKALDVPVAVCGEKAFNVLTALGFSSVVRNGDYSYGNFDDSRAAVKCVEMPRGSFVYFAVASPKKERAQELRDRISAKF